MKSWGHIGFGTLHTKSRLINKFLTELKTKAAFCNHDIQEKDRMARGKIVFTITVKLQELLLRVDGFNLEKAVKLCRSYEQSTKQVKEFKDNLYPSNSASKVDKVAQKLSDTQVARRRI